MKTEPYDPDKHGDGYSVLVPMHVEPPEGVDCRLWGVHFGDNVYHQKNGFWFVRHEGRPPSCAEKSMVSHTADGWTFWPAKPEPEKSYAKWLTPDGTFIGASNDFQCWLEPECIKQNPEHSKAVCDFIQDTLNEGEA